MSETVSHQSQITTGLRSIFSAAPVYRSAQRALGADRLWHIVADDLLRLSPSDVVIDVGCGTADILDRLPAEAQYIGLDPSEKYIAAARRRYGDRGRFLQLAIEDVSDDDQLAQASHLIAIGVLHHLDDDRVRGLFDFATSMLRPGGHLITVDPTFVAGQSLISRSLVRGDRGQHVRRPQELEELVRPYFRDASIQVRNDLLRIPYDHVVLQAQRCASESIRDATTRSM